MPDERPLLLAFELAIKIASECKLATICVRFVAAISQRFRLMQLGGGLGEIAANIALESQRNRC